MKAATGGAGGERGGGDDRVVIGQGRVDVLGDPLACNLRAGDIFGRQTGAGREALAGLATVEVELVA